MNIDYRNTIKRSNHVLYAVIFNIFNILVSISGIFQWKNTLVYWFWYKILPLQDSSPQKGHAHTSPGKRRLRRRLIVSGGHFWTTTTGTGGFFSTRNRRRPDCQGRPGFRVHHHRLRLWPENQVDYRQAPVPEFARGRHSGVCQREGRAQNDPRRYCRGVPQLSCGSAGGHCVSEIPDGCLVLILVPKLC